MNQPPKFYKVIVTAPDGRFGTRVIEGGIDKKTALWHKKQEQAMGMVVSIKPEGTKDNERASE